jgi:predicted nucleotidyltransferase
MAQKLFIEVENTLLNFCAARDIPVAQVRFFGSRTTSRQVKADSDLDILLVSGAFDGKDIFERVGMVSGLHRALVKQFKMPFDIVYCSTQEWQYGNSPLLHELRQTA